VHSEQGSKVPKNEFIYNLIYIIRGTVVLRQVNIKIFCHPVIQSVTLGSSGGVKLCYCVETTCLILVLNLSV